MPVRHSSVDLGDALAELDATLELVGVAQVEKAGPNPLKPKGFDQLIIELERDIRRVVGKREREAIARMIRDLDRNWSGMTEAAAATVIAAAVANVGKLGPVLAKPVGEVVMRSFGETTIASNAAAATQYNAVSIMGSTDLVDNRVVKTVRTRQAFFVRNEYGVRQQRLSAMARNIVADGTANGFTSKAISETLSARLGAAGINRSVHYYRSVAGIYQARARSYGLLRSFADGGIDRFRFEAVLDKQTTEQCRFMHGKTFSVPRALKSFNDVTGAGPESVYALQPFMNTGRDANGNSILYYSKGQGGPRVQVARVDTPGVGAADRRGGYSRAMSSSRLESAGITTPPLHGLCRSTILAEV